MRTTVSLPDDLFSAAESLARRLGVGRSELFAMALAEFVARHSEEEITSRLNQIYTIEDSRLEPILHEAQRRSLGSDCW
jgi:metal-responsive CopG/Arc/MetJ family transcriptional regulator